MGDGSERWPLDSSSHDGPLRRAFLPSHCDPVRTLPVKSWPLMLLLALEDRECACTLPGPEIVALAELPPIHFGAARGCLCVSFC